jgi:putative flippase GtrA
MTKPINLSIFFPVYNEEENIREAILRTIRVVEDSPYIDEYEILVVNDGSTDESERIALLMAKIFPQVRVVDHPKNKGYGEALKTGIARSRMDYVFFTDADLQFDIVELQNLLVHLDTYPVVIGYRSPRRDPFMRLLNAWGWNKLNRLLFGLKVRDIDCAFKIFRRKDVQGLDLRSKSAMISAETLIRLSRSGIAIKEVPVSHLPRTAGSPTGAKPSVILRALKEMLELYRGDLGLATQKEALRFMSVGVINTLLDVAAYIVLTRATGYFADHLTVAKFLSFLAGTVSSLTLNRTWTFGMRTRLTLGEVLRFYAMTSVSLALNVALMSALVGMGMYDLYALSLTTVFTFAANFTLSKFWVFKRPEPRAITEKTYAT